MIRKQQSKAINDEITLLYLCIVTQLRIYSENDPYVKLYHHAVFTLNDIGEKVQ